MRDRDGYDNPVYRVVILASVTWTLVAALAIYLLASWL